MGVFSLRVREVEGRLRHQSRREVLRCFKAYPGGSCPSPHRTDHHFGFGVQNIALTILEVCFFQ